MKQETPTLSSKFDFIRVLLPHQFIYRTPHVGMYLFPMRPAARFGVCKDYVDPRKVAVASKTLICNRKKSMIDQDYS
jgi:hypothetical protein